VSTSLSTTALLACGTTILVDARGAVLRTSDEMATAWKRPVVMEGRMRVRRWRHGETPQVPGCPAVSLNFLLEILAVEMLRR
jgi:hypothetical protein